jgi:predicted DNA-binding protein
MSESVVQRTNAMSDSISRGEVYYLLEAIRTDLEALRSLLNTHVHSGVTAGGANTGAPTTTIASLETQP